IDGGGMVWRAAATSTLPESGDVESESHVRALEPLTETASMASIASKGTAIENENFTGAPHVSLSGGNLDSCDGGSRRLNRTDRPYRAGIHPPIRGVTRSRDGAEWACRTGRHGP